MSSTARYYRKVVEYSTYTGRDKRKYYTLVLECGHVAERRANKDVPKFVICTTCWKADQKTAG